MTELHPCWYTSVSVSVSVGVGVVVVVVVVVVGGGGGGGCGGCGGPRLYVNNIKVKALNGEKHVSQ